MARSSCWRSAFPAYTTSAGWLGYPDDKLRRLSREGAQAGWTHLKIKVGRDRTPRVYRTYGSNLIGFVHGDGVKKTHELAGHMAREMAMDWGACPHRTIYTGHLHHEMTETDKATGVVRRQLISLAGTDRWHSRNGFQGAPKGLPAYIHDKNRGMVAAFHAPPED